jgi:hypothetical protein
MNALCKAYLDTADADRAVRSLLEAGVPGADVRLLMGATMYDARREAAGGFAGAVPADAKVGAFAGECADRGAATGSFADDEEQVRVAGHGKLKSLLVDAGLDDSAAETDVRALHDGRVLVLVTLGAVTEDRAREVLEV